MDDASGCETCLRCGGQVAAVQMSATRVADVRDRDRTDVIDRFFRSLVNGLKEREKFNGMYTGVFLSFGKGIAKKIGQAVGATSEIYVEKEFPDISYFDICTVIESMTKKSVVPSAENPDKVRSTQFSNRREKGYTYNHKGKYDGVEMRIEVIRVNPDKEQNHCRVRVFI